MTHKYVCHLCDTYMGYFIVSSSNVHCCGHINVQRFSNQRIYMDKNVDTIEEVVEKPNRFLIGLKRRGQALARLHRYHLANNVWKPKSTAGRPNRYVS